MSSFVRRVVTLAACSGLVLAMSGAALAQHYTVTALDSNLTGKAKFTDPLLKNAWGLAYAPTGPFWISDEASGWTTLYDGSGNIQALKAIVPPSSGTGAGTPTGIVYNGSTQFKIQTPGRPCFCSQRWMEPSADGRILNRARR